MMICGADCMLRAHLTIFSRQTRVAFVSDFSARAYWFSVSPLGALSCCVCRHSVSVWCCPLSCCALGARTVRQVSVMSYRNPAPARTGSNSRWEAPAGSVGVPPYSRSLGCEMRVGRTRQGEGGRWPGRPSEKAGPAAVGAVMHRQCRSAPSECTARSADCFCAYFRRASTGPWVVAHYDNWAAIKWRRDGFVDETDVSLPALMY